jgi:hypothetical protein
VDEGKGPAPQAAAIQESPATWVPHADGCHPIYRKFFRLRRISSLQRGKVFATGKSFSKTGAPAHASTPGPQQLTTRVKTPSRVHTKRANRKPKVPEVAARGRDGGAGPGWWGGAGMVGRGPGWWGGAGPGWWGGAGMVPQAPSRATLASGQPYASSPTRRVSHPNSGQPGTCRMGDQEGGGIPWREKLLRWSWTWQSGCRGGYAIGRHARAIFRDPRPAPGSDPHVAPVGEGDTFIRLGNGRPALGS